MTSLIHPLLTLCLANQSMKGFPLFDSIPVLLEYVMILAK
jgi:hypothetical protein